MQVPGDEDSFLDQFETYMIRSLKSIIRVVVRVVKPRPKNKNLAQEVQMVWNELRKTQGSFQKEETITGKPKQFSMTRDDLILLVWFLCGSTLPLCFIDGCRFLCLLVPIIDLEKSLGIAITRFMENSFLNNKQVYWCEF